MSSCYAAVSQPIPSGQWTDVEISQKVVTGVYLYQIKLNNDVVYSTTNDNASDFHDIKIYVGRPSYDAQPGFIRNLIVDGKLEL